MNPRPPSKSDTAETPYEKPAEGANPHAPYYPALTGLRGIAVLAVFFGHYAGFRPGWMGVDIFFVLSGFLITGILYDARNNRYRFRNFYIRRTLRIFPAYYAFWLMLLVLTPLLHIAWQPINLLWPLYLGNWIHLFSAAPNNQLLAYPLQRIVNGIPHATILYTGHFWTLCIEEQFYLIWPLVVFTLRKKTVLRLCAITIVVSPLVRIALGHLLSPIHFTAASTTTFLRLDGFLLGGFAALALRGTMAEHIRTAAPYLFWASATGLASAALYYRYIHEMQANPVDTLSWIMSFGITLVNFMALGTILMCLNQRAWISKFMSVGPLRALGKISYGFYIFHDPPHAAYAHAIMAAHLSPKGLGLLIPFTGTLLCALASYYLIERPFLNLKTRFEYDEQPQNTDHRGTVA